MARKYWSLADYSIVRKMYTGYASTVYQATCKRTLEQVALKVYHMENLCELNHFQVYREIRLHSALQHQNIIQLYCSFQEGNDVVMVQEYAEGGDLYRLLHRNGGRLAERQAVEMVLHPFLLALHYLHTHGIMHRDIKP
ncbi:serine/threonine protein kinase, partial [Haematococcus lacustris]